MRSAIVQSQLRHVTYVCACVGGPGEERTYLGWVLDLVKRAHNVEHACLDVGLVDIRRCVAARAELGEERGPGDGRLLSQRRGGKCGPGGDGS